MEKQVTSRSIATYCANLYIEERSEGTISKYKRDLEMLSRFLDGCTITAERVSAWKHQLLQNHSPRTVNSMLAAVNGFCRFQNWPLKISFLKIQHQPFRDAGRELTRSEYEQLLRTAKHTGQTRLALIMETLCATGIRVSELRYITVEAARQGRAAVQLKGKVRTILLPGKLCRKLLHYAQKQKTTSSEIFLTRSGRGISRRQVWFELKRLSKPAGVDPDKIFPHNFRHLFATVFYKAYKDIARLADVLGHSSIETTRIYLAVSGAEQARQLDRLGLVT